MDPMKVLCVAGARPNFMKIAPLLKEMARRPRIEPRLVHSGQHYDHSMSQAFFEDLSIRDPDVYLGVGSGSHAEQTARIMLEFEKVLLAQRPDVTVVVGDVNSTLACALTAAKLLIPVAHVEAGLRSFDRTMPEEINRKLTDQVSELLFTPSTDGDENLAREGIDAARVHFVGNVMIDCLKSYEPAARARRAAQAMGLEPGGYALLTLHRPSNVDDPATFSGILDSLERIGRQLPIVFPIHPRTRKQLAAQGLWSRLEAMKGLVPCDPMGYIAFLSLMADARLVLTDSGGVQEETTALSVPCLTLRQSTERPVTVTVGTNQIVGTDPEKVVAAAQRVLSGEAPRGRIPPLWDGRASERIVDILQARLSR